ncbi:glycoside hydrolase family 32 protein [Corynebacterium pacaense]|uniref:glycoside hydrolase family 32 protein n=1 Tax=Corynebacterium pacaense TaxID=1816684 RepID=UPI0009BA247A|nr:glycoside hydrolase family 32 protein [Corynebacterium pacaense]
MQRFRPRFHLTPPTGRLNDPNGLYLDGDILHAYYQHDPGFPHGNKRTGWGHASTSLTGADRLRWYHHPDALYPDMPYDLNGCYSGCAVVDRGQLRLFYTGNLKAAEGRRATQNMVLVEDPTGPMGGIHLRSPRNPLIDGPAAGFTAHYRDPMIFEEGAGWRMILGAQRDDGTGSAVLYRSADLENWHFDGELLIDASTAAPGTAADVVPGGYMWECPNLFSMVDEVSGEELDVLIICPQGLERIDGDLTHYASSDQCGYLVGRFHDTTFTVLRGFSELDHGHEFYAPQVTAGGAGVVLMGWMGLPGQDDQPTVSEEGWVHCLSVPRILRLVDGVLHQELIVPEGQARSLSLGAEHVRVDIRSDVHLEWDGQRITVDRAGDRRSVACPPGELMMVEDATAIEITAGNGRVAFALRSFSDMI